MCLLAYRVDLIPAMASLRQCTITDTDMEKFTFVPEHIHSPKKSRNNDTAQLRQHDNTGVTEH
eukprot:1694261-Amphidinium_carterae.1